MEPGKIYVLVDTAIFGCWSIYALIMLVMRTVNSRVRYQSRIVMRSIVFTLAFTLSFMYLIVFFNPTEFAHEIFETLVTGLKMATCLCFYFTLQEWDALVRSAVFSPCRVNIVMVVVVALIAVTGLSQLCTYYIQSGISPHVHFYVNSLATYIQMMYVLAYGCFRVTMTTRDLEPTEPLGCQQRCISVCFIMVLVCGVTGFGTFIGSFCVNLDDIFYHDMFSGFCTRFPVIIIVASTLFFQDVMDKTVKDLVVARQTEIELI